MTAQNGAKGRTSSRVSDHMMMVLSREAVKIMSGFSDDVAMAVTSPLLMVRRGEGRGRRERLKGKGGCEVGRRKKGRIRGDGVSSREARGRDTAGQSRRTCGRQAC